jgi:hypothetical protein
MLMGTERLSDRESVAAKSTNRESAGADLFAERMERSKKNDEARKARTGKLRGNGLSATFGNLAHLNY